MPPDISNPKFKQLAAAILQRHALNEAEANIARAMTLPLGSGERNNVNPDEHKAHISSLFQKGKDKSCVTSCHIPSNENQDHPVFSELVQTK